MAQEEAHHRLIIHRLTVVVVVVTTMDMEEPLPRTAETLHLITHHQSMSTLRLPITTLLQLLQHITTAHHPVVVVVVETVVMVVMAAAVVLVVVVGAERHQPYFHPPLLVCHIHHLHLTRIHPPVVVHASKWLLPLWFD